MRRKVVLAAVLGAWCAGGAAGGCAGDLTRLARRLEDARPEVRIEAARALNVRSPRVRPVLPQLGRALKNEYWDVRQNASEALRKVGADAVPVLVEALRDKHVWSRVWAARTLGRIGPAAETAVPAFAEALRDKAIDVRCEAGEALAAIGQVEPVTEALTAALADPNDRVRSVAAKALAHGGRAAVARIVPLLEHADMGVRRSAAQALAGIGPDAAEAVPALVRRLKEAVRETNRAYGDIESEGIRNSRIGHAVRASAVVTALAAVGAPAAEPTAACLQGADETTCRYVFRILGRLGPRAREAVPFVLKIFKTDDDPWQRARAAGVLGSIGTASDEVLAALAEGLRSADEPVRRYSADALGRLGPKGAARLAEVQGPNTPERPITAAQGRDYLPDFSEGLTGLLGPFLWSRAADLGAEARFCDANGRPNAEGRFLWLYQFRRAPRTNPGIIHLHERNNLTGLDPNVAYEFQPAHVLVNQPTQQNLKLIVGYIQKDYQFEHGDNEDLVHLAGADRVCVFIPIRHGVPHAGAAVYDQHSYWVSPVRGQQSVCVVEFKAGEQISYDMFGKDRLDKRILFDLAPYFEEDKRVYPGVTKPIFRFTVGDGGGWKLQIERDGRDGLKGGENATGWDITLTHESPGARPYTVALTRASSTWALSAFSPGGEPEETSEIVVGLNPFDRSTGRPVPWPDRSRRIRTFRLSDVKKVLAGEAPGRVR